MKRIVLMPVLLITMLITVSCTEKNYPLALVWNNIFYYMSVETVLTDDLDGKIGEITKQVKPMPQKSGEANFLPVGTKLYKIKGENDNELIAVEYQNGYRKASIIKKTSDSN